MNMTEGDWAYANNKLEEKIASLENENKELKQNIFGINTSRCLEEISSLQSRIKELNNAYKQSFITHGEIIKERELRIKVLEEALKQTLECDNCDHCRIYAREALSKSRPCEHDYDSTGQCHKCGHESRPEGGK